MRTLLLLVLFACSLGLCAGQTVTPGLYPTPISAATLRPITSSSECGVGENADTFCAFTTDTTASLAPNCMERVCNGTCPFGSSSPTAISLATLGIFGVGVTTVEGRPGSTMSALRFDSSSIIIPGSRVPPLGDEGLSFSAWINQDPGNTGTLISKSSGVETNYAITVSETSLTLNYLPASLSSTRSVIIDGLTLNPTHWHLVTVTVYDVDAVFYVNGSVVGVRALEGSIQDSSGRDVLLGQLSPGTGSFSGMLQDISYFTRALTTREVTELFTGVLLSLHLSPHCRCPPSHPLVDINDASCVQQPGVGLPSRGSVERLNPMAYPAGFANDFSLAQGWISTPGQRDVNVTVTLTNSLYELIFINVRYGSPRPRAVVLETSRNGGLTFEPIQYYADDCMQYFGLPNNGQLMSSDDVNCITTFSQQIPTANSDVRLRFIGADRTSDLGTDLNTSPELRQFISATHFRLRFVDYFESSTTLAHRYYSILEFTIVVRCACNGHAERCGFDIDSICECVHNTRGPTCQECLPFYNDKPWRYGQTDNAFPCKPCDCNGHAFSCHYDPTFDLFPDSYDLGGGGVCDDCQNNTAGPHCETCVEGYFTPAGVPPTDPNPCTPCSCNTNGITDTIGDCAKGQGSGGEILGQCLCKPRVTGLKCDTCRVGFFNLTASNPEGCVPCACNTNGTFDAVDTCDPDTGRCQCKTNVRGLKCDQCAPGTTNLTAGNVRGCEPCGCDPVGSLNSDCDIVTGVCECKPGVGGVKCNRCMPGFFGFSESGCEQCECVTEGALNNVCDTVSGVCSCADNVVGDQCESCEDGFYNITEGCLPCGCNTDGTLNATTICNKTTGACPCKTNVDGDKCDSCLPGFSNLIDSNPDGCSECDCFDVNTDSSDNVCDPVTLQCECNVMATGLRCESCLEGFYQTESGCVSCNCDAGGAASGLCDPVSGQCNCTSEGVSGRRCDSCLPGFFQFPQCVSCGCDPAGSVEGTVCDLTTGVCSCKLYVTGVLCDSCVPGFQRLEAVNPFGCSAQPDEQAPPSVTPTSANSVLLTWFKPEAPNGFILNYTVLRDSSPIATVTTLNYTDSNLAPNTAYRYSIEAANSIGTTRSVEVEVQTLEGIPEGVTTPTLMALSAMSIRVEWIEPATPNGVVIRYEIVSIVLGPEQIVISESSILNTTGNVFSAIISDLRPFFVYSYFIRACTSGGCGSSDFSSVETLQAPPTFQPAPNVTTISSTELRLDWSLPPSPNGILSQFEVFQRESPFTGEGISLVNLTVQGQLSQMYLVQDLRPFMTYEYSIVSFTRGGGTQSNWTQGVTAEDAPEGVAPPTITALSSTSLHIAWIEPSSPNGIIRRYGIYQVVMAANVMVGNFTTQPDAIELGDLSPFTEYSFFLEACTAIRCTNSDTVTMATLEGDPIGQPEPIITNVTSTSVLLSWAEPVQPNGVITGYSVQRRRSSVTPLEHDVGVSFDGTGITSFPPGVANLGGFSNEIRLMFRTLRPQGTLLYYINLAGSDLLAIGLRGGLPYFIFDAGTGSGEAVPSVQSGVTFSDGEWHSLVAVQNGRTGTIKVDGVYSGSGQSLGQDSVIASSQGLHIGGVPSMAPLTTLAGGATVSRSRFAGCLFDVVLNGQSLDVSLSSTDEGVDLVNGCPVDIESGWRLVGAGYVALEENSITMSDFSLTFDLHTRDSDALVLFMHSEDLSSFLALELRSSTLYSVVNSNETRELLIGRPNAVCAMEDITIRITVNGSVVSIHVPMEDTYIVTDAWSAAVLSSAVYFGGIPRESPGHALAAQHRLNVGTPLSGCVRAVELVMGGVNAGIMVGESMNIRFDGCGPRGRGCVSSADFSVGPLLSYTDSVLEPFTGYLHRVISSNSVGSVASGWVALTTLPGVPSPITVSILSSTANSLTVTWSRPNITRGLITSYDITANPLSTVGLPFTLGGLSVDSVVVSQPDMTLMATLSDLEPATTHQVTVTSYTSGGSSTGPPTLLITGEAVPVGVQAPVVTLVESQRLGVTWQQPTIPNGIITRFDLFVNDEIQFSGTTNTTIINSLLPFTEYSLHLQACTSVGCTNSSMVTGQTLPDRPMGLAAPNLTALSPSSIEAMWQFPLEANGAILRFELRELFGPELSLFTVVFSGLALETTLTGLTPNTLYTYQLVVFNAGGSTASDTVSVVTLEGVPDGVSPPIVGVINSTTLNVTWVEPTTPNGIITQYILLQNRITIFTGLGFHFVVLDLQPFSYYSFSIMACTVRNCSSSAPTVAMTSEATPTGFVAPTIVRITPILIELLINPVNNPNGIVTYSLIVDEDLLYNSTMPSSVVIGNLSPFTEYSFMVEVRNSAGTLVGPTLSVSTEPTAPAGLAPPTATPLNATAFQLEWAQPSSPNGLIQSYEIIIRGGGIMEVLGQGTTLVGVVSELRPFTVYYVMIRANNTVGSVVSMETNFTTGETAPAGFDRIVPLETSSRHILLSWDEPAATNGILVNYTIFQQSVALAAVPPTLLSYNVTSLLPFTEYSFVVEACTSVGCVASPELVVMTMEDLPEGLPELSTTFVTGRVLITWTTPMHPNGIISEYRIERTTPSNASISLVGSLTAEPFVVADIEVIPFMTYMYRLVVTNGAGAVVGNFTSFTTPQAAPEGVLSPSLEALSSTSIQVTFAPPLTPNGIVTMYTITRLSPVMTFTFTPDAFPNDTLQFTVTDSSLTPFTSYTYTLEVCTLGGCGDSDPTSIHTLEDTPSGVAIPTIVPVNSKELQVTWRIPDMPNGIIENFDLLRIFVGFDLATPNPINCCEEYILSNRLNLTDQCDYVTSTLFNETIFTDSELRPFTYYQYCIITTNGADSAFSQLSSPARTDPAPLPLMGPSLNATTLNSTAIELSWSSVNIEILLGPLEGYTVFGGVAGSNGFGVELFSGMGLSFVATGLIASTEYVFVVAVSNGEGVGFSNNATAVTEEGIPANLAAPTVVALSDTTLSVTFSEPAEPNGVIVLYTIYLDGVVAVNITSSGTVTLTSLTPYTLYIVRVEACTQFGCTISDPVAHRTLEGVPAGLASPFVTITGPTSADITWSDPNQPNGVITEYQLLQFRQDSSDATLVFSGLNFSISVSTLSPFTTYNFQVVAINGAGNITSLLTRRTTDEAPPTFVSPPTVSVRSAVEIFLSWSEPNELNGMLVNYQVYRQNAQISSTLQTSYSDSGLQPATTYAYVLEVCTNGGCTNSSVVTNTTFEALPEAVSDPILVTVGLRSATLRWGAPMSPNGVITEYILTLLTNSTQIFSGLAFTFDLNDLTPYTNYSFLLETCNSIGCVSGARLNIQTLEDIPEGLKSPRLRDLTSTEVAIEWSAPSAPNGDIISYILYRSNESFPDDPEIIFEGLAFSFNDAGLVADTLYFYSVEAVNGAGSVTSATRSFQTVPDLPGGVSPPVVEVRGSTEIFVSWSEPSSPNGDISSYTLFINGNGILLAISFQYTARDLTPFTVYSFYFEVCNQAGCASSVTVTVVTDQALADSVTPPTLTILSPTSIQVSWLPPLFPNGVISHYEIRRRLLGNIFSETIQHSGDSSLLSFTNIGLTSFTNYEYRLNVVNGAGQVFSDWINVSTPEDIPAGVLIPMFADQDVFARNVTATWLPPSMPNGILLNYRLEYRTLINPITNMPGNIVAVDTLPAGVTMATAVGLLPVTTYQFRIVAINSAGEGASDFETITTREDAPEQLQPILVSAQTGTSLSLSWSIPLTPNGQIRVYMVYLDGTLVYDASLTSTTIQSLQPFTTYSLQLAACTSVACGFGLIQNLTTAMTAPSDQPAPTLIALSARSVQVNWDPPTQPNGEITFFEVLRRDLGDPISELSLVSTPVVNNRVFIDTTVRPAMSYEYAIRAINDIGNAISEFQPIRTPEAVPEGIPAPVLNVLNSSVIMLTWSEPISPNGLIQTFRVFRSGGGSLNISVFDSLEMTFTDGGLSPFTTYSYFIQACTLAGCSSGPRSSETTAEALPADLQPPLLSAISASSVSIVWSPPDNPNGVIVSYMVTVSPGNIQLTTTTDLNRIVTNLSPFTEYTVILEACNSVGCTQASALVRTRESIPQFLRPPTLMAINATSVDATWIEPPRPNGVITRYILRRDGTPVFDGNALVFLDTDLSPDTMYSYTLQAFTSVGPSDETSAVSIQTLRDTPENVLAPVATALSSSFIEVVWSPPGQANGVIQRYTLLQDTAEVFSGLEFMYVANGLQPFTEYVFQLMVCTTTCGTSENVTERTLEALPTGQIPPTLVRYRNSSVEVSWSAPSSPNGVIISYLLERRLIPTGSFSLVSSQLSLRLLDQDSALVPAMTYEYRVTAINSVGQITSEPSTVTLFEAAPEGVPIPIVREVTNTSINVSITPPTSPNGVLTSYILYRNGQMELTIPATSQSEVSFVYSNLDPFTEYMLYVEVCTSGGCGQSEVITVRTQEATPIGQAAPQANVLSARSIQLSWSPPSIPNGIVTGYSLWYRTACPSPPQPRIVVPQCMIGPRSLIGNYSALELSFTFIGSGPNHPHPYTSYQFIVIAGNSVGAVESTYSSVVMTPGSQPEAIVEGLVFLKNDETGVIFFDWSQAFRFNSEFVTSSVERNGILLVQRPITSLNLTNEPRGETLNYVIRVLTRLTDSETAEASMTRTTQLDVLATPSLSPTTPAVTAPIPTETPFYQQAPFIIGMIVLGVVVIFVIVALVIFLLVRPRGDSTYKSSLEIKDLSASGYSKMEHSSSPPRSPQRMQEPKHVTPSPRHMTGSWSPGDPYDGEIPDYSPDNQPVIVTPRKKKYSPHRIESASLIENEHLQLPDTVISSHVSPHQFVPAKDDFGSFKAQHHTTFTDTKV